MHGVAGRFPVAVASGGLKSLVLATLDALGIHEHFQAVVTYEDVVHPKPAPDTYLEAARRLGVEPAACLVFEDTPLGIEAATAAGMQSVLVASGPVVARRREQKRILSGGGSRAVHYSDGPYACGNHQVHRLRARQPGRKHLPAPHLRSALRAVRGA